MESPSYGALLESFAACSQQLPQGQRTWQHTPFLYATAVDRKIARDTADGIFLSSRDVVELGDRQDNTHEKLLAESQDQ